MVSMGEGICLILWPGQSRYPEPTEHRKINQHLFLPFQASLPPGSDIPKGPHDLIQDRAVFVTNRSVLACVLSAVVVLNETVEAGVLCRFLAAPLFLQMLPFVSS